MFAKSGCLFLATVALVTALAVPTTASGEPPCLGLNLTNVGQGVGAYVEQLGSAIGVTVASGVPDSGMTITLLIAPELCASGGLPNGPIGGGGGLPPLPALGQSAPGIPLMP